MGTPSVAITQGGRREQQDQYCIHQLHARKKHPIAGWLIAIFDGHGGSVAAAEYCRRNLLEHFKPKSARDVSCALERAVRRLAEETAALRSGTTLSAACILEDERTVVTATVGDSPIIVLGENGRIWHSDPHNVGSNMIERAVAEQRGAMYENVGGTGYIRLPGQGSAIQLSRALGDADMRRILSDKPDMKVVRDPTHVIIASDGLWSPSLPMGTARSKVEQIARSPDASASTILDWRIGLLAEEGEEELPDNTTVLLWKR